MFDSIIKLIFPPKCMFCGSILNLNIEVEICSECMNKIPFFNNKFFKLKNSIGLNYLDDVICLCHYSGIIKDCLIRFKFFNKASYYRTFGKLLSNKVKSMTDYRKFDIIISVPLHKSRLNKRGYNQSLLISKILSGETGIPEKSDILSRIKNTHSQSLLTRNERYENVRDAFKVNNINIIKNKCILIVDDILTTGNTLNECSRVLKEAGAKEVVAAVIASGRKY